MNLDPFSYIIHRPRRVGQRKADELARGLQDEVSYKKATRILKNHDLHIERREFYNLTRTENLKKLKPDEELTLLLSILDNEDFRVGVQEKYNQNDLGKNLCDKSERAVALTFVMLIGERISRVVQNIFFCNSEQIRLARRFVSTFVYETDATFDTNELRMPFSVLVGVLNTGKTFPFALCFITSESVATFDFMEDTLDELFFYNCPRPKVVFSDFAKRLAKSIATRETKRQETGFSERYTLQLFEWHGVEAIKQQLVAAGKYPKEQRDKVIDLIWEWVKSQILNELEAHRTELLNALLPTEKEYLPTNYKPKEHQFIRAYIKMYPNLGVNSTQRSESYHAVIKRFVNWHISLADSVRRLQDHI